ncbi:MAG: hypothetical protein ABNG98_03875 [Flavobacterium sp.]|jgi:hypothetical protein
MEEPIITEIKREPFIDENGIEFHKITYETKTPRKTFILGNIKGKYRGTLLGYSDEFYNSDFYDFEIYEALVDVIQTSKNIPFDSACNKNQFPREKLPELLKVHVKQEGEYFELGIIEPKICDFESKKKLHQIEGNEIFGTFTGTITGYVFDYEISYHDEVILIEKFVESKPQPAVIKPISVCSSNGIKTGKLEIKNNYTRYEYFCKHHQDKVWGNWVFNGKKETIIGTGCFSSILQFIGFIILAILIITIFPGLLYIGAFLLFFWLINIIANNFRWVFNIIGILFLIGFLASIINVFTNSRHTSYPNPVVVNNPRETKPFVDPIVDDAFVDNSPVVNENEPIQKDSLIKHYREWKDYDGNLYQGYYTMKLNDYRKSKYFKNNLSVNSSNEREYDKVVYQLKENDKSALGGLYKMLDSIGTNNKLNKKDFAEMVVSFVQDIPYALILSDGCDPSLYSDRFTRNYLLSNKGYCDGNQRFGINAPAEFMTNLKGDCDSRSLLLYTIFSHYNYDVALMSSEFYGHSILGINLPINGLSYPYKNQNYVLWETTASGLRPGQISNEMSNINNWRISLKSK